ncbi:ribosome biogenesis protein BOP1-like [Lagopus muta]|uniref:ribosome biogenesis protein BOP1-like n=1 Tax=Lagopus muta TaxID=64668 RepID=UPI00209FC888|nr:ribosome biogenesis protein BOP1-like [Lagopus muta]
MEQPLELESDDDLTDSEESVYSGLEDSGSDSTNSSAGEEEDEDEREEPGSGAAPEVKGAPRKSKVLGADPPPKDGEGLNVPDEYVEDSSDEEVGPPANLWMQHRAGGFLAASPSVQTQREGRWVKELWV